MLGGKESRSHPRGSRRLLTVITIIVEAMMNDAYAWPSNQGSAPRGNDIRRYFPEWADRATRPGVYLEADRNSYLAGGYAEEFGYGEQRACRANACVAGAPERCCLWGAHVGGLHPGYPECATPHQRSSREAHLRLIVNV